MTARSPQLFDAATAQRWTGSTALVVIRDCPDCGGRLATQTVAQPALFIHGGYGATRTTTWRVCINGRCRWSHERVIEETRPDRRNR